MFVSRCQNLETEYNTTPFAAKNPDGGFYYTPAAGGAAGRQTDDGGLRSYGSMTYAGLKSMIYAGLGPDDPRVKAAVTMACKALRPERKTRAWARPACIYYYQTFAKALAAVARTISSKTPTASKHDWRKELIRSWSSARQKADGSWVNESTAGWKGTPNLVTGYACWRSSYCPAEEVIATRLTS